VIQTLSVLSDDCTAYLCDMVERRNPTARFAAGAGDRPPSRVILEMVLAWTTSLCR
jgi:hypothetical protein